jgi:hypothetical protein
LIESEIRKLLLCRAKRHGNRFALAVIDRWATALEKEGLQVCLHPDDVSSWHEIAEPISNENVRS